MDNLSRNSIDNKKKLFVGEVLDMKSINKISHKSNVSIIYQRKFYKAKPLNNF
jgi:hypothetical protein